MDFNDLLAEAIIIGFAPDSKSPLHYRNEHNWMISQASTYREVRSTAAKG